MAIGFWSLGGFIIGLLGLPRRIAVVDEVAAALHPGVAHGRVFVERGLLDHAGRIEQFGPARYKPDPDGRVARGNIADSPYRVGLGIDQESESVANSGRTQDRQNQVRAAADTPPAQCLPEILAVLLQSNVGREVENAGDPESRIEKDPSEILEALLELALQHIVHRNPDVLEIGKKIGNAGTQESRKS